MATEETVCKKAPVGLLQALRTEREKNRDNFSRLKMLQLDNDCEGTRSD